MEIDVGFEISYKAAQPTPMVMMLSIHPSRSVDIVGKTLSGMDRSFCVASFSALVECGGTKTTRVVKVDFN